MCGSIKQMDTICLYRAGRQVRHDLLRKRAIHTKPESKHGSLRAMTCRQDNDTPALNALKALRGAPTSMGRGEIPVEPQPAAVHLPVFLLS